MFTNDPGDRVQSQIMSYQRLKKWYLMRPYLTLNVIRYVSRVNWRNPEEGVAPSSTPWSSSFEKGAFGFPSTTFANFTLFYISLRKRTLNLQRQEKWGRGRKQVMKSFPICKKVRCVSDLAFPQTIQPQQEKQAALPCNRHGLILYRMGTTLDYL